MDNGNTPPPRPQLSVLGLMIWAVCFVAASTLIRWIDRVDRARLGAARFDSPAYQKDRWSGIIALNLLVVVCLVGEWLATRDRNRRRHRAGLPPLTMTQRWDWLIRPVLALLALGLFGLLGHGLKVAVFNEPPTPTDLRVAIGLVVVVIVGIPSFNLAMIVLVWSLIPFLWIQHKLSGPKSDEETPPGQGHDDPTATTSESDRGSSPRQPGPRKPPPATLS
jgi:hypothetical protein